MWDGAAADLVVVVHLLFICFVVCGALVEIAGFGCPLTSLEQDLRRRAGEAGYRGGFIAHYLVKVIYPPGLTRGMQIGLGIAVLMIMTAGYWGLVRRLGSPSRTSATSRSACP